MQNLVFDLLPGSQAGEHRRDIESPLNGEAGDRDQVVVDVDSGLFARAARGDVDRDYGRIAAFALRLIGPRDAVVGQVELALLLKVDGRGNHGGDSEDHQQRADELLLQLFHRLRNEPR